MSALTNLGIVLTAIFIISLAALAAQIAWVIWRRNRFLRYNNGVARGGDTEGDYASGGAFREPVKATKELLYFFCWKDSQSSSRVEPDRRAVPTAQGINASEEEGDNEVLKWHAMYRESRMLYTINEEEKEGEAATESDCSGGGGLAPRSKGMKGGEEEEEEERSVCLKECLDAKEGGLGCQMEAVVAVKIMEESSTEHTPFSTPFGSPDRYFTPSPSPPRAEQEGTCRDYAKMAALC